MALEMSDMQGVGIGYVLTHSWPAAVSLHIYIMRFHIFVYYVIGLPFVLGERFIP